MSKPPMFTKDQPKDGDLILHCGHLSQRVPRPAHWFKYGTPLQFERPNGTRGQAEWFASCESCFVKHGEKIATRARGDSVWTGDAPIIEKPDN
jgi:hypothetical protein